MKRLRRILGNAATVVSPVMCFGIPKVSSCGAH
jgi:hypothetical protein